MNPKLPPPRASYRASHRLLGPPFQWLGMSCRHFTELTLAAMDRPLTRGEKVRRGFHFAACSVCRGFDRQMKALGPLMRAAFSERTQPSPDPEFLGRLHRELSSISDPGTSPT